MALPTMVPVASTSIRAIGYDDRGHHLYVEFVTGDTYVYDLVSARAHRDLLAAESIGAHFNREIRGRHPYRQLED